MPVLSHVQEQSQEERKAHQAGGGAGTHMTGTSTARGSVRGLAAAPAFDLEKLLQGAALLPSTHGPAPYASLGSIDTHDEVSTGDNAAATQTASASMEWTEEDHSCSPRSLRSLEVSVCGAFPCHKSLQ